ncbi:cell elongation-specific peptidoglycan D,D-transpeptidase [Terracoccus luteus]|jgi:peptidoglycan glycosyltransferase|uniref:Cell elongation-specific peptidoglycan D,D-transpeptidase n=1 Tax=Terracoccus luteus TaxID=53356 RepID=A0A495Y3J7_9MICO|nr:penicillin-binding transpeptidase domain-containing protein [Terracoccus luteus]RKT79693.1 cell elongation-specific peptidoglycan D,D-transpeptidase [Terracoccus luteus]
MNAPIRRISVLIALLFTALLVSATVLQAVQARSLGQMTANKRTLLDDYSRERGAIVVDGQNIAESVPVDDQYQWLRRYPQGPLYSQVTGFYSYVVGAPYGLEHASNDLLSGDSDSLFVNRVTDLLTGRRTAGATIELTLNAKAQKAADEALGDSRGAVVALDPRTGAILAMVSHPEYDPNPLSSHNLGTASSAWKTLSTDPDRAYTNRAIGGNLYPPGSTFKVVTAAAALEDGLVQDENSSVPGPATLDLPLTDTNLPNENRQACGPDDRTTLLRALEISCNTAFGSLGLELGGEKLRAQAAKFGFGDTLNVPLRVTPSSVPADLNAPQAAQSAIGQYDVRTTPLQMAMVAAGIANGGRVMTPYLIDSVRSADLDTISGSPQPVELSQAVSERTAQILTTMMVGVVENGSGARAQISGVAVAGKTGTAQHDPGKPPHAWFISFAPADDPKVAVAVVVEDGGVTGSEVGGGRVAAPIAKAVMEAVLQ